VTVKGLQVTGNQFLFNFCSTALVHSMLFIHVLFVINALEDYGWNLQVLKKSPSLPKDAETTSNHSNYFSGKA
jgi:hypothetical protein